MRTSTETTTETSTAVRRFVDVDDLICPGCGYRAAGVPSAYWQVRDGLPVPQFSHSDRTAAAESLLSKTDDPLMLVGVAQRAATAYAVDGQYKACMVELERAQDGLASAGPVSPESPAYFYNEGYLTSHRSECLLRLGESREAAASASAGLMLYDKSFVDGYAVCTLHLGNARLQIGEIDEATKVIFGAASLAAQTRSARLVKELRTTRARMQPWQNTPAVKALDEQLAGMRFGA